MCGCGYDTRARKFVARSYRITFVRLKMVPRSPPSIYAISTAKINHALCCPHHGFLPSLLLCIYKTRWRCAWCVRQVTCTTRVRTVTSLVLHCTAQSSWLKGCDVPRTKNKLKGERHNHTMQKKNTVLTRHPVEDSRPRNGACTTSHRRLPRIFCTT